MTGDVIRLRKLGETPRRRRRLRLIADGGESVPERPEFRSDCADGPRPCPWAGCAHHTYLRVVDRRHSKALTPGEEDMKIVINHQVPNEAHASDPTQPKMRDLRPDEFDRLAHTCILDIADDWEMHRGADIGEALGVSQQRVWQEEQRALVKLRDNLTLRELAGGNVGNAATPGARCAESVGSYGTESTR